ncbi:LPS assembly lipoprotein LptE [Candidatus Fukatsuia anoeciicola]|uniref:LPS assembly lipoprotein LptE n=1 Tax=Candidatus Fukatsuia anoeciicola TaxID=2994492 RepID=UPI0034643C7F
MRHRILTSFLGLIVLVNTSCSFHLYSIAHIPLELQTILLESSDPYDPLTYFVRQQLSLYNINIIDNPVHKDIPILRIIKFSNNQNAVSIFQDGTTAENQLVLRIQAQMIIPRQGIYPLHVTIFRSFFDNPLTALAKDAENNILYQEMFKQAAKQLVQQLLIIDIKKNKKNEKIM